MKVCSKCGRELDESEFYKDPRRPNGLRSICKSCWSIRKKEYRATHKEEISRSGKLYYQSHKEQILARQSAWQRSNRKKVSEQQYWRREDLRNRIIQLKKPCGKCGEDRHYLIQFHHIDPSKKAFEINQTNINRHTEQEIVDEVSKCVCLCSNCHLAFHFLYGKDRENLSVSLDTYLRGDEDGEHTRPSRYSNGITNRLCQE